MLTLDQAEPEPAPYSPEQEYRIRPAAPLFARPCGHRVEVTTSHGNVSQLREVRP